MAEDIGQQAEQALDDWGDERRSFDQMATEEATTALYPDEEESVEGRPEEMAEEPEGGKQQSEKPQPANESDDAVWSNEDLQTISLFEREAAQFRQDIQAFAQVKNANIDQLAGGDKAKAVSIKQQIKEAEDDLRQRYGVLQHAAGELANKVHVRNHKRVQSHIEKQRAQLAERVPDLDKEALRVYLTERGFSKEEIGMAADARIIEMAEKARRWDARDKQPKKVPRLKKAVKRMQEKSSDPMENVKDMLNEKSGVTALYGKSERRRTSARPRDKDDVLSILYGS